MNYETMYRLFDLDELRMKQLNELIDNMIIKNSIHQNVVVKTLIHDKHGFRVINEELTNAELV